MAILYCIWCFLSHGVHFRHFHIGLGLDCSVFRGVLVHGHRKKSTPANSRDDSADAEAATVTTQFIYGILRGVKPQFMGCYSLYLVKCGEIMDYTVLYLRFDPIFVASYGEKNRQLPSTMCFMDNFGDSYNHRWPLCQKASRSISVNMAMDQYLLIPFLGGWTSINPSYFDVNRRGTRFWHTAISTRP